MNRIKDMDAVKKKAYSLLARKAYFSKQLKAKLLEKGFPSKDVDFVIADLIDKGWLNDGELASRFIEKEKKKGYGARVIAQKLKEKAGFVPSGIEESREAIEALVAKKYAKKLPEKRMQVIGALMRRGVPYDLALEVIDNQ